MQPAAHEKTIIYLMCAEHCISNGIERAQGQKVFAVLQWVDEPKDTTEDLRQLHETRRHSALLCGRLCGLWKQNPGMYGL